MKKWIPNSITLLNLLMGSIGIVAILQGNPILAIWMVVGAGIADFADGMFARLLNVQSEIGKQLDSLADMISFGLLPGMMFYYLLLKAWGVGLAFEGICWYAVPAFLVPILSAVRLANFNIDERQTENFIGLPTPALAIFAVGYLATVHYDYFQIQGILLNPWLLYVVIVLLSILLVAEIPMFSFKFKNFSWQTNKIRYIFAAIVLILTPFLKEMVLSIGVLIYVLINIFVKNN